MAGARIKGHPIHPMIVAVPIGLCTFSFVADLVRIFGWGGAAWFDVALYTIAGGIIGALIAAVPGFIDYLTITDARVRDMAFAHMVTAVFVIAVFGFSWWLRWSGDVGYLPVGVSLVGLILLGVVGWLGGEMVFVHGMGMEASASRGETRRRAA